MDDEKLKRPGLLKARFEKEIVPKVIPLLEKDIRESEFRKIGDKSGVKGSTSALNVNGNILPDSIGFIKRVRYHQLLNKARLSVPPNVDDFVREERIPPATPQNSFLDMLFPVYRPLNPIRVERKTLASTNPESCKILVQVLRGFNLPMRIKDPKTKDALSPSTDYDPTVRIFSWSKDS